MSFMCLFLSRFLFRFSIFLLLGFSLLGCSASKKSSKSQENSSFLLKQAYENLHHHRFSDAIKKFDTIKKEQPYASESQKAFLSQSVTYYMDGQYDVAIDSAKNYLKLYQTTADADLAQYIMGLSYFQQIEDILRDQNPSYRCIATMQELIRRWPQSHYVQDAKEKIRFAEKQIAGHEMHIGRYYLQKHAYISAIGRFLHVKQHYSHTAYAPEAIARLVESYYAMGLVSEAHIYFSFLAKNYPKSEWYTISRKILGISLR